MSAKTKSPFKQYEKLPNAIATIGEVQALIAANNQTQNVGLRLALFLSIVALMVAIGGYAFTAWVH